MHRAAKWKAEKNRLQVVFKLHLEATQIPQPGWEKLFVSLTSVETGKSTAKTTRVSVRDGSCKWDEPLYETTRLLQDAKTRKFDEKLYKLAVSTGSSRHGLLGEASINLADYAEVSGTSAVSLPLQRCNYGTILHVTVHTLNEKTGFREFEQQNLTERGARKSENRDDEPNGNALVSEGKIDGRGVKEKRRSTSTVRLRPNSLQVPSVQPNSESNGNHRGCLADDAISCHPDKKHSAKEKVHEVPENGDVMNAGNQDAERFRSQMSKHPPKSNSSIGQVHAHLRQIERSSGEWTHGWSSDYSTENDAANVYEENEKLRVNMQAAESSIMQLKTEVASLEKRAEGQAAKIETLMQQLSTEKKQGQDCTDKNLNLKSEGDCKKLDLEQLESLGQGKEESKYMGNGRLDVGDTNHIWEDLKKELDSEKQVNINLRLQLEKTRNAYSELLHRFQGDLLEKETEEFERFSDERPQDMLLQLDTTEINLENRDHSLENAEKANGFDGSGLELQISEAKKQVNVLSVSNHQLETRIQNLEEEKLELQKHLNTFLKKEQNGLLGDGVTVTEKQSQLGTERSPYAETGEGVTYSKVFSLEEQDTGLNSQQHYVGEYKTLLATAEVSEELGKSKTNSVPTPEQEEKLCELSPEADDYKRACNSVANKTEQLEYEYKTPLHELESRISYLEESEKQLQGQLENLRNEHAAVLYHNSTLKLQVQKLNQELGQQAARYAADRNEMAMAKVELEQKANRAELVLKRMRQSNANTVEQLQKELQRLSLQVSCTFDANEKLATRAYAEAAQFCAEKNELEDQLKIMHKSLQNANEEIAVTRQQCEAKLQELRTQMELSNRSEEELQIKLENTSNELESQIKSGEDYVIREKELSARTVMLEREVQELLNAKSILIQKADEYHIVKAELETIRINLDGCKIERMGLESSLQRVNQEKSKLEKELSLLKEILRNSDTEVDELKCCKDELQKEVASLQSTLEDQLVEQELKTEKMKHLILSHKELKQKAEAEASQLRAQKNDLEEYSAGLQESLENTQSEIASIKEQYELEVQELMTQLDMSNKQREELFSGLQNAWNDSGKLSMLESELQAVLEDKSNLTQRLKECDSLMSEFAKTKLTLDDTKAKNDELKSVLEKVKQESGELTNEVISFKEALKNADTELDELRSSRNELKITVAFLKSKLDDRYTELSSNREQDEITDLERQHSELKRTLSDKELEMEDLRKQLFHSKELLQKADVEASQLNARINELEKQLSVSQESMQMENVGKASVRKQFEVKVQELDLFRNKAEELSLDLQNAMRKIEVQTKNESNFQRINEDLCFKISALKAEVETALNEKRQLLYNVEEHDTARAELESSKRSLEILSNRQQDQIIELERQHSELKHILSDKELEMEDLRKQLFHSKELLQKADIKASQLDARINELEKQLSVSQESLQMENTEKISVRKQFEVKVQELDLFRNKAEELSLDLQNAMKKLEIQTKNESNFHNINEDLCFKISALKAEVETALNEKKKLLQNVEEHDTVRAELESSKRNLEILSNQQMAELIELRRQYSELKHRFSEQELKMEDLRKHVVHSEKHLQKADMEASQLKEKKNDLENQLSVIQESLERANAENDSMRKQLEGKVQELVLLADSLNRDKEEKGKLRKEIGLLKEMLRNSDTALDELKHHKDKLETTIAFLQTKVDEQNDELMQLRSGYTKLKDCLSEQDVKTEELRRHSIQLEELKQNAEEEAAKLRVEKKKQEEHSMIVQESLRIAFIREQFEAKEQAFLNQLDMSKRYGEELLSKLQDTTKELDILKSSEAHYMKKTEELSVRLKSLEMELQSVLKEKNDLVQKVKECNQVKAEFEGTRTSLDICKAEKEQLEYLLQRADLGKEQLHNELCSLKEMLRYSDVELDELKCCKDELELKIASLQSKLDSQNALMLLHEDEKSELIQLQKQEAELKVKCLEQESKTKDMEKNIYQLENELQQKVDTLVVAERKLKNLEDNIRVTSGDSPGELKSKVIAPETSREGISANGKKLLNENDKVNLTEAHLNEETLTSSMDRLYEELEKMKHENLAPFQQENELCELHPQEPFQKEMEQLQMVNKQLENMFPSFKEPLKSGNVIDRVLALERELADALKSNDTKRIQFQSSFVKQQADQAAMLQSFRDINDLINDMLEIKNRNSVLEDELKDLQNRYSQVSLKFAEVEGERQQLVMTLKNLRVGKKQ